LAVSTSLDGKEVIEQRGLIKAMKGKKGGRVPVAEPGVRKKGQEDHDSMQPREQCESG
jgi:hypothetical protein